MAGNRFGRERRSEGSGGRSFSKDNPRSGRRFSKDNQGSSRRFDKDREGFRSRSDDDRVKIEFTDIICDKCGKRSKVPFKPTENKPVYCRDCFQKPGDVKNRDASSNLIQLCQINQKLDKIMEALNLK